MNVGLRRSLLRSPKVREDFNPMEGTVNIVDAMLVFACGLMLSLIINWNVDVGNQGNKVELNKGKEVSEMQEVKDSLVKNEEGIYEKMGIVYKDPKTGKLFMLTDN